MSTCPSTPHCPGDPAWASPNGGHLPHCMHPQAYEGDLEFRETDPVTAALPAFMTLLYLFGAAAKEANREQRQGLRHAREMLKARAPLPEVANHIFAVMGTAWEIPAETMQAIEAINQKEQE